MLRHQFALLVALTLAAGVVLSTGARAQTFPARQVTLVVPYAPGGPLDMVARTVGQRLSLRLGQPVVVENKAGASGAIGTAFVARAEPDGHTLLISNVGDTIVEGLGTKLPYRFSKDLAPITTLGETPFVLIVGANSKFQRLEDLVASGKGATNLNYGSPGVGLPTHLAAEIFNAAVGIKAVHVPYNGQSTATAAVVSDVLSYMFASPVPAMPLITAGRLRALATTGRQRFSLLPNTPTVAETAIPGFELTAWFGLNAPAGTPVAVLQKLNQEVRAVLQMPEVQDRLKSLGVEPKFNSPAEFASLIQADIQRWEAIVKSANIEIK